MQESGQAFLLVRLEHLHPRSRQEPEHREQGNRGDEREREQLPPPRARQEEHRSQHPAVDDRRSDVGLEEDQEHRQGRESDSGQDRLRVLDSSRPVGEEPGEEEDEEHLAELGRLQPEKAEVDPPSRAADCRSGHEDEAHHRDRRRVEDAPVPPVDIRIDRDGERQRDRSDRDIEALTDEVVARIAGDVVARHSA